jgi:pyrroline-5-carboxylate reductase
MKTLGFIGGGRITKIILQAFKNSKTTFDKIAVCDTNQETLQHLKKQFPEIKISIDPNEAAAQEYVFIALHPPAIMEALGKIKSLVSEETKIISLAPKITLKSISTALVSVYQVARLIPSATSFMNLGYNPASFSDRCSDTMKKDTLEMLRKLGTTFEVAESKLEGYAIASAMLPTYFWFQWQKMVEIAEQTGMAKDEANEAIYSTLKYANELFFKSGLSPVEVMDLIPVKPIGAHEEEIKTIYDSKLMGLFEKIKPS